MSATDSAWHSYWKGNPIKAFTQGKNSFFIIAEGHFAYKSDVLTEHRDILHELVWELVDLRLEQYSARKKTLSETL